MATLEQIIQHIPVGKGNAMRVSDFEQAIGNQNVGTNNDQTRREVDDAIINHDVPIGSNPQCGYWLINSDDECNEVVTRLKNTAEKYRQKAEHIRNGWNRRRGSLPTGNPWPK